MSKYYYIYDNLYNLRSILPLGKYTVLRLRVKGYRCVLIQKTGKRKMAY